MATTPEPPRTRLRLSQETIAIITVGIALAGLNLATVADLRDEARTDRAAWLAESRNARDAWQAESRQLRNEARADREHFQREIQRLIASYAKLGAIVAADQPTRAD